MFGFLRKIRIGFTQFNMFSIKINKISDDLIEVFLIENNVSRLVARLDPSDCLQLSNLLMDAAEDLIRYADPSFAQMLNDAPTNQMIN